MFIGWMLTNNADTHTKHIRTQVTKNALVTALAPNEMQC